MHLHTQMLTPEYHILVLRRVTDIGLVLTGSWDYNIDMEDYLKPVRITPQVL
jgi:hypothetical protein